ncbi:hypothetical protein CapIbe_008099 [Capra ibex]
MKANVLIPSSELFSNTVPSTFLSSFQKQLIDGVAQIIFNTSEAIENLSYISLKELNNKYLSIFVEVQESTVTGSGCYFTFPETWDSIFHKGYCCCCCWLELMTQTFQKNIRPAMTIKQ